MFGLSIYSKKKSLTMSAEGSKTVKLNIIKNDDIVIDILHNEETTEIETKVQKRPTRILFEIPEEIESFSGRVQFIKELHDILQQNTAKNVTTILSQPKNVSDLGGIGKTETAIKYISVNEKFYENVIWIQAETEMTLQNSFIRLAEKLQILTMDFEDDVLKFKELVENVYQKLCVWKKSTLFVFDNADDFKSGIEKYLPSAIDPKLENLTVLVTSRSQNWKWRVPKSQIVALDLFTPVESLDFILKQLEIPDSPKIREETREFIELIGGLPLALQQSVAFIRESIRDQTGQAYKFSDYITKFKSVMVDIPDYNKVPGSSSIIFVTSTATSDKIKSLENGEMSIKILETLAFLYADKVPATLIKSNFPELKKSTIFKCLTLLEKYSLITGKFLEGGESFVSIHRQLQVVILNNLKNSDRLQSVFDKLLGGCRTVLKMDESAKSADIFTNFHHLLENPFNLVEITENVTDFMQDFSELLDDAKKYSESLNLCNKIYNIRREILGENHVKTLTIQHEIAQTLNVLGKNDEALSLLQDVLERMEIHLDPEHQEFLEAKHSMASVLDDLERYEESLRLFEEVLEQKKKVLGDDHESTLDTKEELEWIYSKRNKASNAVKLVEEKVTIVPEKTDEESCNVM